MLFKPIDPAFVLSDTFKHWPLETKATFTICAALGNYHTGEFHHATATIAHHANLSLRSVQRSLKRMAAAGQISINGRPKKRSFVYNFAAAVTTWIREQKEKKRREAQEAAAQRDADQKAGQQFLDLVTGGSATGESFKATGESLTDESFSPPDPPQNPAIPNENQERHDPCSLFLTTGEITTTAQIAAEAVPDKLIQQMVTKHSEEDVVVILSGMGSMMELNSDCFSNPPAYFRQCCENGWIPTNKDIQDREKKRKMDKAIKRRQEQQDAEWQANYELVEAQHNDPEAMARVAAAQAEFWNCLDSLTEAAD